MFRSPLLVLSFALLCVGLCFGFAQARDGSDDAPLRIGFNGGENPGIIRIKANAFTAFLEERSGLRCEPVIAESYGQLIRTIAENGVDFAFLSPLGYVQAQQIAGARILLQTVRNGRPYYWSVILVRRDSGLRELGDLKGKRFAFTHLGSTSGYVVPMSALRDEGIDPERYFGDVVYAGGHSAVLGMILSGAVDAGATFADDPEGREGSWTAEEFLPREEGRQLHPIFFSQPIPGDTFTVTRRMADAQPKVVQAVKDALLAMGESRTGRTILGDLYNIDSLTEGTDADYDPIRAAFRNVRQR